MRRLVVSTSLRSAGLSRDGRRTIFSPAILSGKLSRYLAMFSIFAVLLVSAGVEAASSAPYRAAATVRLTGQVIDSVTGAPVASATVQVESTALVQAAGDDGRFDFQALPAGVYAVTVSAVGYRTQTVRDLEIVGDQPRRLVVRLLPMAYPLGKTATVRSRRLAPGADGVIRIDRAMIVASGVTTVAELLEQVPGIYIQRQGVAGPATIRMRGSAANQVLVLVDGVKLNASGSGVADLSVIPLASIESIEIQTGGGSATYGPEALAGTVVLSTRPTVVTDQAETAVGLSAGRWAHRDYRLSLRNPVTLARFENRFGAERTVTDGDFDYVYSTNGVTGAADTVMTGTRRNNATITTSLFASGLVRISPASELGYSLQHYRARRGLPGPVEAPDPSGEGEDDRLLGTLSLTAALTSRQTLATTVGFTRLQQAFTSLAPTMHVASHFDTRVLNEVLTVRQEHSWRPEPGPSQRLFIEARQERLYHDDLLRPRFSMGRADRLALGFGGSVAQEFDVSSSRLFELATIDLAARYDYAETESERAATPISPAGRSHLTRRVSPRVGLALSRPGEVTYTVRASYGKSIRLPEINALFWRGDTRSSGNPDLRPERSEHSELDIRASREVGPVTVTVGAGYFHSAVTDLVVWQPNFQGVWQPQNIGRAQITGFDRRVRVQAFADRVSLEYQQTITEALNKQPQHTVYGRQLPFYPRSLTTIKLEVHYGGIEGVLQHRRADRTYTNEANTKSYAPYAVTDVRLSVTQRLAEHWQVTIRASIENLADEHYVLSAQYPMPGRQLLLGATISYGLGRSAG